MVDLTTLKSLINLIGGQENYSINGTYTFFKQSGYFKFLLFKFFVY